MKKSAAAIDDRQGIIPIYWPPGPRLSSDEKARSESLAMVESLAAARTHPWRRAVARLQVRVSRL